MSAAERAALACGLLSPDAASNLAAELQPEDFGDTRARRVFRAMLELLADSRPVDLVTVADRLGYVEVPSDERAGIVNAGLDYLADVTDTFALSAHLPAYIGAVKDAARRRLIGEIAANLGRDSANEAPEKAASRAQEALSRLSEGSGIGPTKIGASMDEMLEQIMRQLSDPDAAGRTQFGLSHADALVGGMAPGEMVVLAARPSVGKTAVALNIARNVALTGQPVLVFSLEMSREALRMRLACMASRVSSRDLETGSLGEGEMRDLRQALRECEALPAYTIDTPGLTVPQMRARAQKFKREHGLALVVVDYLQLAQSGLGIRDNPTHETTLISQGVKAMARELDVPVLCLSQLRRIEEGSRPKLHHLRQSGSIEQDADMVLLLHRFDYQEQCPSRLNGLVEINIAKNRNGPTGVVYAEFIRTCGIVRDCTPARLEACGITRNQDGSYRMPNDKGRE